MRALIARLARPRTLIGVAVLLAAGATGLLVAWFAVHGSQSYAFQARFASAQGVFPGAPVSLLGVRVGSVQSVETQGSSVLVTMRISSSQPLPSGVVAELVEPELLGTPDIELSPGYTGGPKLAAGALIPEDRTEVPATTDQLLNELQRVLGAIKPGSARQLVQSLATDLQGEGAKLNSLLANAAGTVSLLANKGDDLGRLDGQLAALTGTLRSHDTQLADLITAYDTVSAVLAGHQQQLGDAITQLANASEQLASFLTPNLRPLQQDVAVITTVGRTLDRNLASLDQTINSSASLFAAAHRAYDPVHNWLDLNAQASPGFTVEILAGLVRDRLAGICRRVLAHHSAGLSSQALQTLAQCGNPRSSYFDPVLGIVDEVINGLPGGSPPSLPSTIGRAVGTIPGLSSAQRKKVSQTIVSPPPATTALQKLAALKAKYAKHQISLATLDKAIDAVLGSVSGSLPILSPSGTTGTSGATGTTGTSGTTGLGGLVPSAAPAAPAGWGGPGWSAYLGGFLEGRA